MRWLRWAAGSVVAVALLGLTAVVFVNGTGYSCDDSATIPYAVFTGEVVARSGGNVTFRVDDVRDQHVFITQPSPQIEPGEEVTVEYGGDARFLHTGQSYLAPVFGSDTGELRGFVSHGRCGTRGTDTVHANGTEINTSIFTLEGFQPYWPRLGLAIVAVAAVTLLVRWRIRVKHPRLTIDGQPLTKR